LDRLQTQPSRPSLRASAAAKHRLELASIQSQRVGKNRFELDLDLRVRTPADLGTFVEALATIPEVEILESAEAE